MPVIPVFRRQDVQEFKAILAYTVSSRSVWDTYPDFVVQSQPGQIVHENLSQKTHHKKRAGEVAHGIGPEFKSQYHTHTHIHTKS
jgi:hypothetical protein